MAQIEVHILYTVSVDRTSDILLVFSSYIGSIQYELIEFLDLQKGIIRKVPINMPM